jgi:hypothetical protein
MKRDDSKNHQNQLNVYYQMTYDQYENDYDVCELDIVSLNPSYWSF